MRRNMNDFSSLIEDEENERIREVRAVAQAQFVQLSEVHLRTVQELNRYKAAYGSASTRARELSMLLTEGR
jgi:hypothetical protein